VAGSGKPTAETRLGWGAAQRGGQVGSVWMWFMCSCSFLTSFHWFLTFLMCIFVILDIFFWFLMYCCDYWCVHVNLNVDVWLWVNGWLWICVIANVRVTAVNSGERSTFVPDGLYWLDNRYKWKFPPGINGRFSSSVWDLGALPSGNRSCYQF
jgi:hypothetical protein